MAKLNSKRAFTVLVILVVTAFHVDCIADNILPSLLKDYQKYGLRLPSREAKLVAVTRYSRTYLGFLENNTTNAPVFLLGPWLHTFEDPSTFTFAEIDPEKVDLIELPFFGLGFALKKYFEVNYGLCLAIQCESRGWHSLAAQILNKAVAVAMLDYAFATAGMYSDKLEPIYSDNLSPKEQLWYSAWHYYCSELGRPGSDRAFIGARMEDLARMEPALNSQFTTNMLRSIRETVVPRNSKAGSVDHYIDQLTEITQWWVDGPNHEMLYEPRMLQIVRNGFDAIPTLIKHAHDIRLTRNMGPKGCGGWCPPFIFPVSYYTRSILEDMSPASNAWINAQSNQEISDLMGEWWTKAKAMGEENYFLNDAVLFNGRYAGVSLAAVEVLSHKYPHQLPVIYRKILNERSEIDSGLVAMRIGESILPLEEKVNALVFGTQQTNWDHRVAAFIVLGTVDERRMATLLITELEKFEPAPHVPYEELPGRKVALIVSQTASPEAWQALERKAKNSKVGLRMEFMTGVLGGCDSYTRSQECLLKFLYSFLEDTDVRDTTAEPGMYKVAYAGCSFPGRLSVQNYAAILLCHALALSEQPERDWNEEQWTQLRTRARLAAELRLKTVE